MKILEFDAELLSAGGGGVFVDVPYNVPEIFGKKGMVKVIAKIDGADYRGSLSPMIKGKHCLIVLKDIRKKIGKEVGDMVHIYVEEDTEVRTVELPDDLKTAIAGNTEIQKFFEKLAFTHKREYVRWITEAKRPETRANRIEKAVEMLKEKKKWNQ